MTIQPIPVDTNPTVSNNSIGIAVMAKSMDTAEQAGQGMIKMMEQSVNPNLGQSIDMTV